MKKRLKLLVAVLTATCLFGGAICLSPAALSKIGSRGDEVRQIQTRLKKWGYYSGSVDGIYGTATKKAVQSFQQKNGLTADGIAGPKTLKKIGISSGSASSVTGQVAVGAVVLNRVEHPSFPNSVSGVIYQSGAFSCLYDGQFEKPVADSAYRAARDALNGMDPSGGAIYYFNPATATSKWIWSRPLITVIGKHRFCK